jgi:hypothetical protein
MVGPFTGDSALLKKPPLGEMIFRNREGESSR